MGDNINMARYLILLVTCYLAVCSHTQGAGLYDGYELWSVDLKQVDHVHFMQQLREEFVHLDFWNEPVPHSNVTVLLTPELVGVVRQRLMDRGVEFNLLNDDLQSLVDAGSKYTPTSHEYAGMSSIANVIDHTMYHSYTDIQSLLEKLRAKYPDQVQVSELNHKTHQGRGVSLVKLTGTKSTTKKKAIIIEAGIHAREWISPAANLYFLEKLLQEYQANDATAKKMLDSYDWYMIPVTNPDGYAFTHSSNRLWRKNRRFISGRCIGVDLNRNFDAKFGTTGVSNDCNSIVYPGHSAFSEPETTNIKNLFEKLGDSVKAYLSAHSYSQVLLVPWTYSATGARPKNSVELDRVGKIMQAAIEKPYGTHYQYGTGYRLLGYAASGTSMDWALLTKPDIYSYSFELRPSRNGHEGFVLPPNQIVPTGQEYFQSLAAMVEAI